MEEQNDPVGWQACTETAGREPPHLHQLASLLRPPLPREAQSSHTSLARKVRVDTSVYGTGVADKRQLQTLLGSKHNLLHIISSSSKTTDVPDPDQSRKEWLGFLATRLRRQGALLPEVLQERLVGRREDSCTFFF